jgi:hypothetical protein
MSTTILLEGSGWTLPLLLLVPLFLHFLVICRLCSHEGSLLAFKLSLRVIWFWDEHSLHAPFSYRHAVGKMGTHYYMPNFIARLSVSSADQIYMFNEMICCVLHMCLCVLLSSC